MEARTTIVMLAFISPALLLAYIGITNHPTSAYAQDGNPLSKVPIIGDLMGGGENQSQQLEKINPMK